MSARRATIKARYTANVIQRLASANNVAVVVSANDLFAHHVKRLSGDDIHFDPIENTIVALQRAGILIASRPSDFRPAICAKIVRDLRSFRGL